MNHQQKVEVIKALFEDDLEILKNSEFISLMEEYGFTLNGTQESLYFEKKLQETKIFTKPETSSSDLKDMRGEYSDVKVGKPGKHKGFKFQQIKPSYYDYVICTCILPKENKSRWYYLNTKCISSKLGKENKEEGKLTWQRQHRGHLEEGQITATKEFYEYAILIEEYPYTYDITDEQFLELANKIDEIRKNDREQNNTGEKI
jgi:hypothetical protein